MRYCTRCRAAFRTEPQRCPNDGGEVVVRVDDPLVGYAIGGRYKMLKRIAHGGMGVIYRAEHLEMGKHFAVKVLYGDVAADEKNVERFKQEARAASRLDHPNIISITDFDRSDQGILYLVMELLHGEDLYRRVARKGPYDLPRAVSVIRQICRGLGNAHHQGLVHRDLKCENIFLARREETNDFVKILDFGLAHLRDVTTLEGRATPGESEVGIVFGTPEYMSPEQALGHQADARSDLYSLGIIFYRLVSGVLPYTAQHPLDVCTQQILDPPRPLRQVRPDITDIPEELEAVIRTLLAKRPEDRPKDAAAVLALLDPFPPFERYGLPSGSVVRRPNQAFVPAPRHAPGQGRQGVDPRESPPQTEVVPRTSETVAPPGVLPVESAAEKSDGHLPTFLKLSTKAIQHLASERASEAPETAPPTTSSMPVSRARGYGWVAWAAGVALTLGAAVAMATLVGGLNLADLVGEDTAAPEEGSASVRETAEPKALDPLRTVARTAVALAMTASGEGTATPELAPATTGVLATAVPSAPASAETEGDVVATAAPATGTAAADPVATAAAAPPATAAVDASVGSGGSSKALKTKRPKAKAGDAKSYRAASKCLKSAAARAGIPMRDLALDPELGALSRNAAADAKDGAWATATTATARLCDSVGHFDYNRKFLAAKLSAVGRSLDALEAGPGAAIAAPLRARWNKVAAAMPSSLASATSRKTLYGELVSIGTALGKAR